MKFVSLLISFSMNFVFGQNEPPVIDETKCERESLEVLFLNGVRNTTIDAEKAREHIWGLVTGDPNKTRISPNGLDDICYKYIYNQTEGCKDFPETLAQKVRETDVTRILT